MDKILIAVHFLRQIPKYPFFQNLINGLNKPAIVNQQVVNPNKNKDELYSFYANQ